jgi:Dolichyl-phosphate-mannose-protein mannosyltransferase
MLIRSSRTSNVWVRLGSSFRWLTIVALTLITLIGAYLRLHDLGAKTVAHVEMYVPGIRTPDGISIPEQRLTLKKVLTGTFSSDTHPPGYYVLMWCWTKSFGTSERAIRLPSALFGIGCIPLLFWLANLLHQRTAGWIAAMLLAVHGQNIFWSQVARMFTLVCFLGLIATILLIKLARCTKEPEFRRLGALYMLTVLAGLSSHIFFWALLGTHLLWTFLAAWSEREAFPRVAKMQVLTLILGSPLLAFAAYQNGNDLTILGRNPLLYAREFLQFSFLLPLAAGIGLEPLPGEPGKHSPYLLLALWLFFFLCLSLFAVGVASIKRSGARLLSETSEPSWAVWGVAALPATAAILVFIYLAKALVAVPNPTLRTTEIMVLLPTLILASGAVIQKYWKRLLNLAPSALIGLFGEQSLVLALAVVPFLSLAVICIFKPIFNARGLTLFAPYLLLVLAWGIVRVSRHRIAAILLVIILGFASYESWKGYSQLMLATSDYKTFAKLVAPQIETTDLVFVDHDWYATPIFYYLNTNWDRYVGKDFSRARQQNPRARIWVLVFENYEDGIPEDMRVALKGYVLGATVQGPHIRGELYFPTPASTENN